MKTKIQQDIWQIMKDTYEFYSIEPESDKQKQLLVNLTNYVFDQIQLNLGLAPKEHISVRKENAPRKTGKRGRPAGSKNRIK